MSPARIADPSVQLEDNSDSLVHLEAAKGVETTTITTTELDSGSNPETTSEASESTGQPETTSQNTTEQNVVVDRTPTASPGSKLRESSELTALQVLQVIETYGLSFERTDAAWNGLAGFVPLVTKQVKAKKPVRLLLPGFPFKSPNAKDKVLGVAPDLGERLALGHLNSLCENVARVYEYGAEINICSDGLVYNDLLGVSDEAVWDYGEAIRDIVESEGLKHISFIRLWDLLDHPGPWTKEFYLQHASCIRREMLYRFADPQFEANMEKSNEDILMTHRGYINAVTKDLAYSHLIEGLSPEEKENKIIHTAKTMMGRWKAYASALDAKHQKDHVRLSIHDSAGEGKLSMSLFPQDRGNLGLTPWHSAIAIELDGSMRTVHSSDVRDSYELVHVDGRPSHYRAKSDMFDWQADGLDVTFKHLYPTGIVITPNVATADAAPSIRQLPMKKVRKLSQVFSPIILRNFNETTEEELYLNKGRELGDVLTWTFGEILKVKDSGEVDASANNVTSNEAMPMHFDGIFKFVDHTDPETGEVKKVLTPPRYQYFTCISTAPSGTGYTLFANSRLFFRHLPAPWSLSRLESVTWDMVNDGFWSAKQTGLPLVVRHKETGAQCLRWHEPWTNTKFSKYYITIENEDQSLVDVINNLVYDYRVCLRFEWQQGDLLINDNVSMLHTRSAFTGDCDREMWRIHFD